MNIRLSLAGLLIAGCTSHLPPDHPCSKENPDTHAVLARCAARVLAECAQDPDVPCAAEQECEAAWAKRCEQ